MAIKVVALNRKAFHDYHVLETYEAGVVLFGTEIKSIRTGGVQLRDAYARVENGEVWLHNLHIARYEAGNRFNHDPDRARKLLLHKKQIHEILVQTQGKGLTVIPLKLYLKDHLAKVEIGVVRGKKQYDKRQSEAKRDADREIARATRREAVPAR